MDAVELSMPTLEAGLLDNDEIVAYLEELGSHGSDISTNRTETLEFRAGLVALDEGLLADGAAAPHTPVPFVAVEDEPEPDSLHSETGDLPDIGFVGTTAFLLGMTLLGASAAAIVFHARLSQILGL